jgi:hypothetical protein
MLGVSKKSVGIPEHERERDRTVNTFKDSGNTKGDQESPTSGTDFQSNESIYTCPHTPFYRETKGLLHSENTLALKEYS